MKAKKSISLFFVCMLCSMGIGVMIGIGMDRPVHQAELTDISELIPPIDLIKAPENVVIYEESVLEVSAQRDTINADTDYIILEKDMDTGEIIKIHAKIPEKYIGLTREQLIEQLKDYEANPPLTELERGFVGVELLTYSVSQVEVQMNYQYIKPTGSFYVVAYDNKLVVMLDDKKTVFLGTQIGLTELPYAVQKDVMMGLFIPNEESLYDFLETYTS